MRLLANVCCFPLIPQEIALQSCGESLLLLLEGDGNLYFKPVCIGTSSTRMYTIKNCTRLPMIFTWKIHQSDSKILSVSPTAGILQPYEAMVNSSSTKVVFCSLRYGCGVFRAEMRGANHLVLNAKVGGYQSVSLLGLLVSICICAGSYNVDLPNTMTSSLTTGPNRSYTDTR